MYIKRLLQDQLQKSLPNRKVLLLLGARQVGKTTLIEYILKASSGQLLNMDIEVDRARLLAAAKLVPHEAVRTLGAGQLLIIDEAQRLPDIGRITKGWYDAKIPAKIILLGSSSATLLAVAAGELTGRNEKLWLTPLLFQEVLEQQAWFDPHRPAAAVQRDFPDQIKTLLLNRLVFGGYPEAYLANNPTGYLTNLSSDYLLKDLFTAATVRSPEDVRRLLLELASDLGASSSIAQLATRLHLARPTVQRYLKLLEEIFVIFSLPAWHTNPIKEVSTARKYYFWDTGVRNALQREWVVSPTRSDIDALWKNWVIAEVLKQSKTFGRLEDLYFWQSRNNSMVDLVVKQGRALHPFAIHFNPDAARPSKSFTRMYGQKPRVIHPHNVLEILLGE